MKLYNIQKEEERWREKAGKVANFDKDTNVYKGDF